MNPVQPRRIALMLESDGPGGAETMLMQMAEELRRRRPEMSVLYVCDGPSHPALTRAGIPHAAVLLRPIAPLSLAARVRAALGQATGASPS